MSRITKFSNFLKNPKARIIRALNAHASWFSDKSFVKLKYRLEMGKRLNLKNPKTFCEKLQWLKLYNHKPEYTAMVDKNLAKEYVANLIGEQYIIPTIAIWQNPDEIDIGILPEQFVLKTNQGAGSTGVVICKDKSSFDIEKAKLCLWKSYNTDIFLLTREWPYKNVKPCIIAEKYMEDTTGGLTDYKFYCFDGKPKCMYITSNRGSKDGLCIDFFDEEGNLTDIRQKGYPNNKNTPRLPENFEEMKRMASLLSNDIPHLRVDFYEVNHQIYFGELTFFDGSGMCPFESESSDYLLGSWIKLPIDK